MQNRYSAPTRCGIPGIGKSHVVGDLDEIGGVSTSGLLTVRDAQTMTTNLYAQVGWSPPRPVEP